MTQYEMQSSRWLWFGMIGAPIIWMIQFVLIWAISEFSCIAGIRNDGVTDSSIKTLVIGVTVIAVIGTLASTFIAFRNWQRLRDGAPDDQEPAYGRSRFMALTGVLLGVVFTVAVIAALLPVLLVSSCGGVAGV